MLSTNENAKKKRNKPCENCRAHRRKCKVTQGNQCDRCIKMNLTCVFKFTAKPTIVNKSIPISKKNKILEQVCSIEREVQAMEQQLKLLNVTMQTSSNESSLGYSSTDDEYSPQLNVGDSITKHVTTATAPAKRVKYDSDTLITTKYNKYIQSCEEFPPWQLTIKQDSKGISFETTIKNVADFVKFLSESSHYFMTTNNTSLPSILRSPNYYVDHNLRQLKITNKKLQIEHLLHGLFQKQQASGHQQALVTVNNRHILNREIRGQMKQHLVKYYFDCLGLITPLFSKPYFLPLLQSDCNSLASTAISAFVAYSQCRHVLPLIPSIMTLLSMTREEFAESLRQEAKELLQETLFDQEPSVLIAGSLMLLSQCALIAFENSEARLYMNLAWRMVIQLKDKYHNILSNLTPLTPVTPEIAIAESWRRTFYSVRSMESHLSVIYDGANDFSSVLFNCGIGLPVVLSDEAQEENAYNALSVFHYTVLLHNFTTTDYSHTSSSSSSSMNVSELKLHLFGGNLDLILVKDIEHLENQLIAFWNTLPAPYRLSNLPLLEYLQMDHIQQCENTFAIYLNQLYYAHWLAFETRVMKTPSSTDLKGANVARFDGDRALLIVSVCCDALTKITQVLYRRSPCAIELHFLLLACDALGMLKKAANPTIQARAKKNLQATLNIFKQQIQLLNNSMSSNDSLSSESNCSIHSQEELEECHASHSPAIPPLSNSNYNNPFDTNSITSDSFTSASDIGSAHSDDIVSSSTALLNEKEKHSPTSAAYFGELKKTVYSYFEGCESST
ncbi:MAG: hypothetical protein EXX96DRAFT_621448 [Benjaminiella poitrasii]|nr:MAG: hypothetical protein EXX96DRAFT_621448 [Benjaminiella poitrasii]